MIWLVICLECGARWKHAERGGHCDTCCGPVVHDPTIELAK